MAWLTFIDERLLIRHILKYLNLWQERIPKDSPLLYQKSLEQLFVKNLTTAGGCHLPDHQSFERFGVHVPPDCPDIEEFSWRRQLC
ncbi:MAG: hypothetical protein JRC99_09300 [Deltaproteobacteria bacterium]|nr:hypothetical protein [Deltaproteobacteria bacterium]